MVEGTVEGAAERLDGARLGIAEGSSERDGT
jgi:hypothetical protein